MANRNFPQSRQFSNHMFPVSLDAQIAIGATGAPTLSTAAGTGFAAITRMAAGQYRIQLQDNYSKLLQFKVTVQSPVTGSNIAATALTPGLVYQITALGTTTQANWVTAGVPSGITAAVGVTFLAAATSSGNGTAKLMGASGVTTAELISSNTNMLANSPAGGNQALQGGYIDFQCMGPIVTMGAYTPAGTVAAPTFTGGALGTHTHSFTPAGTNDSATPPIFTGTPGTTGATSGGTPAGTNSAPAFTGTAASLTGTVAYAAVDPANGSQLLIEVVVSNSSVQ